MCPPRGVDVIDEIGPFGTDESLFIFLESVQNRSPGAPLPIDVFTDINPYLYEPSNLPENIWYLVKSDCTKQSEFGFWGVKDDSRPIYSGSLVVGWRTTLEFHRDGSPNGDQTDWLMLEYSISSKSSSEAESATKQGGRSLCRVFHADRKGKNPITDQTQVNSDVIGRNNSSHDEDDKRKREDIQRKSDENLENGDAGGRNDPTHDEINDGSESESVGVQLARFLEGEDSRNDENFLALFLEREELRNDEHRPNDDYLELADLLDPLSPSSSSENSSCVSLCSDVYFNSVALPNELEAKLEDVFQQKPSVCNCSISITIKTPVSVAPEGPSTFNNNAETAEPAEAETRLVEVSSHEKRHHGDDDPPENAKKRATSGSNDAKASSSRQSDDGKKDEPPENAKKRTTSGSNDAKASSSRRSDDGKDDPPENAKKRATSGSNDAEASSSRQGDGRKKADRGKTIKKFFCFLAF